LGTSYYCEMCGSPIKGRPREVIVEGARLVVCESCYRKVAERAKGALASRQSLSPASSLARMAPPTSDGRKAGSKAPSEPKKRGPKVELEVVENFPEVVKKARERLGWSTQALANRVMESENVIKRIEQGKLRPTIELAKKLEKALGVRLLQPVSEDKVEALVLSDVRELTLGDLANIKTRQEGPKKA